MGEPVSAGLKVNLNAASAITRIDHLIARFPQATARALNRAGVTGRAVMAREVAKDLGLAISKVKTEILVEEAKPGKLAVRVRITGRRIPLIDFGARAKFEPSRGLGTGVTYRLKGGRGHAPNAFITVVGKQHRGVFVRDLRRGPSSGRSAGAWTPNLPIRELTGPSLPYVFVKHRRVGEYQAGLSLRKNLQSELRFAMRRQG
jgi:hypothetical protein